MKLVQVLTRFSPVLLSTFWLATTGCNEQLPNANNGSANFHILTQALQADATLADVTYEVETTTRYLYEGELDNEQDLISVAPNINKERVRLVLSSREQASWVIESLTPSQNMVIAHEQLPNPLSEAKKMVFSKNELQLFDASGNFLGAYPMEMPDMGGIVTEILKAKDRYGASAINEAIISMQMREFSHALKDILAHPSNYEAEITGLGRDIVSITIPVDQGSTLAHEKEAVLLVDTLRNMLLGSRLYAQNGQPVSNMLVSYSELDEEPRITGFLQQNEVTLPSGITAIMETYTSISNVQITIY